MTSRNEISLVISLISIIFSPLENQFLWQSRDNSQNFHTFELSSLLPPKTCKPFSTVLENNNSTLLEVVHKYSPCSDLPHDDQDLNLAELHGQNLRQDKLRAERIRSLLFPNRYSSSQLAATTLPVDPSINIGGGGSFFAKVGLGTPKKTLSFMLDSGSDFTWTQCEPCPTKDCYIQKDAMFSPAASSTYASEPCPSTTCSLVANETFNNPGCSPRNTCRYRAVYLDTKSTEGFVSRDTLTLSSSDAFPGFLFGCSHKATGLFVGYSGIMGLGRGKTSIVEQTAAKYNKRIFSSCLPSTASSGYIIFGGSSSKAAQALWTPMLTYKGTAAKLYGLKLLAVIVAGVQVPVPDNTGSLIDSGFTVSSLPPTVYSKVKAEFRKYMAAYTLAPASGDLDTCYYLRSGVVIKTPKVSLLFGGGAVVDLQPENVLLNDGVGHVCLAFYDSGDTISILGNTMQKGFEVVHDINAARIGFVPKAC